MTEYVDPIWRGLNMRKLKIDEAYIIFNSLYQNVTYLYILAQECFSCNYEKLKTIHPHPDHKYDIVNSTISLYIANTLKFKLLTHDVGHYASNEEPALCDFAQENLREFGVYNLTVNAEGVCEWQIDKEGVNIYWSLLSIGILVTLVIVFTKIFVNAWRSIHFEEILENASPNESQNVGDAVEGGETVEAVQENVAASSQNNRMQCLDCFRGWAIVLMIFVNNGGGKYWWVQHAPWNGLYVADIVFPFFLWAMGACLPLSVKSALSRDSTKFQIYLKIALRSVKLFLIGICLNSTNGPSFEDLRIMGILQRIGIACFICGCVHTFFFQKDRIQPEIAWQRDIYDLIIFKEEFIVMLVLILLHLSIIFGIKAPNCPRGYLGPGGRHANGAYPDCVGGIIGYIDRLILGKSHIYQNPSSKFIFDSKAFDPEGVFGSIMSSVHAFFGVLCGVIIIAFTNWKERIFRWVIWSLFLGLIGIALCGCSKESGIIPLNKNLISLSFVLTTCGMAFFLISILYYTIDVRQFWSGYPFVQCGKNSILLYVGHSILHKMLPFHWSFNTMNTHFIMLMEAIWHTSLWVGIAVHLDKIGFYYIV